MTAVLDHGYVSHVEHWGGDERVIEAARMSTDKGFQGWPQDERLLAYLWEHKHHTPFEMAGLVVEVQLPIFVVREWMRHRTQSYNELSARYTEIPELYYVPSEERLLSGGQAKQNKQSSGTPLTEETVTWVQARITEQSQAAFETYRRLLEAGVARELARVVLPVNTYTRMRASANLRNWLGFLALRLDPAAQWEIRQYAQAVACMVTHYFPRTAMLALR